MTGDLLRLLERVAVALEKIAAAPEAQCVNGNGAAVAIGVAEAARALGLNHKTLRRAIKRGELPHKEIGRRLLLQRDAVLSWSQQGRAQRRKRTS